MKIWAPFLLICGTASAFTAPTVAFGGRHGVAPSTKGLSMASSPSSGCPEKVVLVGPSLFQLVMAKHLKARGIDSLVVCPNSKVDQFKSFIKNGMDLEADAAGEDVISRALFGLPEESDPPGFGWREGITGVVVCAEDAIIGKAVIDTVMKWDGFGSDRETAVEGPEKAVLCAPLTSKVNKEKSMGWMPIFNNDKNEQKNWDNLVDAWRSNEYVSGKKGSVDATMVRFGSLFGGSVDGPTELEPLGLNERVYKMSLEQYRDLRERSFDRFRLGAQVLVGDDINKKPEAQEAKEKNIKGEEKEAFQTSGEYPEQDRTNRHVLASAVAETLCRSDTPEEFTVLSKSLSALPSKEEWDEMFVSPGPAVWPDPADFVMPEPVEE
eukprot:CAMPEP_0113554298 /NCGR_PEP_ID=MMETSP0015_2-20120614/16072_1 /TAXON_ID=2838 /ORGANISM="Odontella" /LENGTH=379 /DNA_ID=CAMNT_0000455425 /DNA_START=62 /DNA_END=1201 /DNA_ORIENTATION=+ /assembly_acc=CAM_ASM_000160